MSAVFYVETYKPRRDAMDFENGALVERIDEYTVRLSGNKVKGLYSMEKTLSASYDSAGKELSSGGAAHWDADADELYRALFRVSHS